MSEEAPYPLKSTPLFIAVYPLVHMILRGVMRLLAPRWHVTGRENIPARGGVMFTPNHISDADPPLVGLSLRRPAWFMGKQELWEIKNLGPIITFAQTFPVERNGADRAALRRGEDLLKAGQALVIFPEGECSKTGEMQELLPGATMVALRAGVKIVPVGIHNSNKIVPYGSVTPRRTNTPVRVHFGKPLDFSDLAELPSREQRKKSLERLEAALREAVGVAGRS